MINKKLRLPSTKEWQIRKGELDRLFIPMNVQINLNAGALTPGSLWLPVQYKEYRNVEYFDELESMIETYDEAVDKEFNPDRKYTKEYWLTLMRKKITGEDVDQNEYRRVLTWWSFHDLPAIIVKKSAPKNDRELGYVEGILESDSHTLLKISDQYTDGVIAELAESMHRNNVLSDNYDRIQDDVRVVVLDCIKALSMDTDPRLIVVYFNIWMGRSQRAIADILDCSLGTVNRLVNVIEKKLGPRTIPKHKGGAGAHVGDTFTRNRTKMNRTHHNPD